MLGIFVILLLLTIVIARHAAKQHDYAIKTGARRSLPGAQTAGEAAREFLDEHGLTEVQIKEHTGILSDYYDPKRRTLFLNRATLSGSDAGTWAVALHEAAHALQDADDGKAFSMRRGNITLTRYAPALIAFVCLLLVFLKRLPPKQALMICAAVWFIILLMNVFSLPVEFNASNRVQIWLERKFSKHPDTVDFMTPLLKGVAWRDTGIFLRSHLYVLHGVLPLGGRLRPR